MGEVARWWREGTFPLSGLEQSSTRIERADLEMCGKQRIYHPGEVLRSRRSIRPRDEAIVFILSGRAKESIHTSEGRQLIWSISRPGDLVGVVEYLADVPNYEVVALTEVHARTISEKEFDQFLDRHPGLWKRLARAMANEVGAAQWRIAERAHEKATPRLAAILLELTCPWGYRREHYTVDIPLTQGDLANLIGTTRETVERALKDWRRENIIAPESSPIRILQPEILAQIAGTSLSAVESARALDGDGGCSHASHHSYSLYKSSGQVRSVS